jgi:hypothetical protein
MVFHRLSASNPKRPGKLYLGAGVLAALALVALVFTLYPL